MIVTVTAHPSIDRTVELTGPLDRGGVVRAHSTGEQAAGKGVNISRVAVAAGIPTVAVVLTDPNHEFVHDLQRDRIPVRAVGRSGVRVNLTLSEPDGTTTKVNSSAEEVTADQLDELGRELEEAAREGSWVVLTGSLPPGAPVGWYAEMAARLASTPVRVAIDTSDEPLRDVVDRLESCRPALLKPNAFELAQVTGDDPEVLEGSPDRAGAAARRLVDAGAEAVLATLGAAGAVLATRQGTWHATPPPSTVVSTVGAGDSSLFGYVKGAIEGRSSAECLALAVAYGTAAAALPGTSLPSPDLVRPDLVRVRPCPDPSPAAGSLP